MATTDRPASDRMDALERRIAKLEAQSQPLGKACPKCHAFGLESYVRRTAFDGQGLQMMRCRFCDFDEENMGGQHERAPIPANEHSKIEFPMDGAPLKARPNQWPKISR
jgi:hypothetical protein